MISRLEWLTSALAISMICFSLTFRSPTGDLQRDAAGAQPGNASAALLFWAFSSRNPRWLGSLPTLMFAATVRVGRRFNSW